MDTTEAADANANVRDEDDEAFKCSLDELCEPGKTFLWDILVWTKRAGNASSEPSATTTTTTTTGDTESREERVLELAERQLQLLVTAPSTHQLVRLKFIEGCVANVRAHRACAVSLRLMCKLFASFATTGSPWQSQGELADYSAGADQVNQVHRAVELAERNYGMFEAVMASVRARTWNKLNNPHK